MMENVLLEMTGHVRELRRLLVVLMGREGADTDSLDARMDELGTWQAKLRQASE